MPFPYSAPGRLIAPALGLCLGAAACAPTAPLPQAPVAAAAAAGQPHVVVISIDGLRPDAIEAAGARNLRAMMETGAYSLVARTILPSKTLPSHTSMLTGVPPEVHGIDWNSDRTDERGTVRVPTVFEVAEARGKTTAAFFAKSKFRHLIRPGTPDFRRAPGGHDVWEAARIVPEVEQFLRYNRPDLLFVHIPDPDLSGHTFGWMSLPYRMAVRRSDAAVGRIVAAAREAYDDNVVIIVTADHGGHGHGHGSPSEMDVLIPWIAWGQGIAPGKIAAPVSTMDTGATALWLLGVDVPREWAGRPVAQPFASYAQGRSGQTPGVAGGPR